MGGDQEPAGKYEGPTPEPPNSDYSTAYEEIIGDNDDLINMIAYCLYKKQKREFIVRHRLPFSDPRVRKYHDDLNAERISTLRVTAEARLRAYADTIQDAVVADVGDEIRTGTIVKELSEQLDKVERSLTTTVKRETVWWKAIIYAVIGGFALGLIIVAASRMGFMNPFDALPAQKASTTPPSTTP